MQSYEKPRSKGEKDKPAQALNKPEVKVLLTPILGHQIHKSQRFGRRFRAQEKRPRAGGGGGRGGSWPQGSPGAGEAAAEHGPRASHI